MDVTTLLRLPELPVAVKPNAPMTTAVDRKPPPPPLRSKAIVHRCASV